MSSVMTIIPINSEKAYQLSTEGIYLFKVPLSANKQQIAQLVENEYNVTVTGVKTLIQSMLHSPTTFPDLRRYQRYENFCRYRKRK
jgi:ribosomal protein L23